MGAESGELYFLGEIDPTTGERSPFVKIGLVRDNKNRGTAQRLKEHQTGNPRQIAELGVLTTPYVDTIETTMHGVFATKRIGGEWFQLEGDLLDSAIARATELVAQMVAGESDLLAAAELAASESSGGKRASSTELSNLVHRHGINKLSLKLISEAEKTVARALLQVREEGVDVDRFLEVQEKVISPTFDRMRFEVDHPGFTARFMVEKQAITSRFTVQTPKQLGLTEEAVEERLRELLLWVDRSAVRVTNDDLEPEVLHMFYLQVLEHAAQLKFDVGLIEARLKAACGDAPGIDGVCTWNRVSTLKESFDHAAFARAHPELMAEYMKPEAMARSLVIAKDYGYRLPMVPFV